MKKIGLALGSGGARGFCHIGVLQAFEEHNIPIHCIAGCSHGALVGGCYAAGVSVEKMKEVSAKSTMKAIMDLNISFKNNGFLKGAKAVNIVKKLIGEKTIEQCDIPFRATACNVNTGELVIFDSGKVIDAMRASMSIPIVFHAVEKNKDTVYVDGGVLERIPISATRSMGADIVIAVDALGSPKSDFVRNRGFVKMFERIYLLMDWEGNKEKVKEADLFLTPDQGDRSILDFNNENLKSVQSGYEAALKAMPQILALAGI